MTEKRFVDYFDKDHNYIIQDLQNEDEYQVGFVHCDEDIFLELVNNLAKENEQLKQELFESEKEWYECHYADNTVRLDSKLEALKEEFKERFGRDFE